MNPMPPLWHVYAMLAVCLVAVVAFILILPWAGDALDAYLDWHWCVTHEQGPEFGHNYYEWQTRECES